jgi:hypothetical protein
MDDVVLMSDARIAAIACHDTGTPLVDAAGLAGLVIDDRSSRRTARGLPST